MFKKLAIGFGVAIAIAAIVICAIPLKTVSYTVNVPYEDVETYYEKEPYTVEEPYTVREPYTASVSIDYRVTKASIYNWFWSRGSDCWVTIQNTDTKSGYFRVTFNLVTEGGATTTKTAREYIAIGEEKDVMVKHDGDYIKTYDYSITPPTKEVTKYRDVTKYREVTKYRDVEKQRTVTRVRKETRYKDVSFLDYWLNYAPY